MLFSLFSNRAQQDARNEAAFEKEVVLDEVQSQNEAPEGQSVYLVL